MWDNISRNSTELVQARTEVGANIGPDLTRNEPTLADNCCNIARTLPISTFNGNLPKVIPVTPPNLWAVNLWEALQTYRVRLGSALEALRKRSRFSSVLPAAWCINPPGNRPSRFEFG